MSTWEFQPADSQCALQWLRFLFLTKNPVNSSASDCTWTTELLCCSYKGKRLPLPNNTHETDRAESASFYYLRMRDAKGSRRKRASMPIAHEQI